MRSKGYGILLTGMLALFSCKSPLEKLARLQDKHPELFPTDTIKSVVVDTVPAFELFFDTPFVGDTSDLFFIAEVPKENCDLKIDSVLKVCNAKIKRLQARPLIVDTLVQIKGDLTAKVFAKGSGIGVSINKPLTVNTYTVVTVNNATKCPDCNPVRWYHKGALWCCLFLLILWLGTICVYELGKSK